MILTLPDVESLSRALDHWEIGEYVSEGFVIIACAGELVADLAICLKPRRRRRLARWSTILLVAALSAELLCLVRTNQLSGSVIGSLGTKAEEADSKARTAIADSGTALTQAGIAEQSSSRAIDESGRATASASNALARADGARKEADSFEKDILSAKTQAADAESHLAEALQRAAEATEALNRIKSPRSLLKDSEVVSALAVFKGTEYMFRSVFADGESINLLKAIDGVLQRSEWKRVQPATPIPPAINVYGAEANVAVSSGFATGVEISVDSTESLASLQALPLDRLPGTVKAAVALSVQISSSLSPSQGDLKVDVQPGPSGPIRIVVGKKP